MAGFEPAIDGTKTRWLTTGLHPIHPKLILYKIQKKKTIYFKVQLGGIKLSGCRLFFFWSYFF